MATAHYHEGDFPPKNLDWSALIPFLGPTAEAIARYDGTLAAVRNPSILLAPLTTQEAVLSSRIEGTQATMGEVLEFEAGQEPDSPERRDDFDEVLNYRHAMRRAEKMMQELPLSQRVILAAHRDLLSGVRGQNKSPGEYRRSQNHIGPPGSSLDEASFVPIETHKLLDGMSAWERYIHHKAPDLLVQLAILHAEFEALHPFEDGNGRLGRMLVPLFLWERKLIREPVFYISAYLEAHRDDYYRGLHAVSSEGDWTGWCRFFLKALQAQASDNLARAEGIIGLYEKTKQRVTNLVRSRYAIHALDGIFQQPIFRRADFSARAGIPGPTAARILSKLHQNQILKEIRGGSGRRSAIYAFPSLLEIAEGQSVF